jgi:hypothetical protein
LPLQVPMNGRRLSLSVSLLSSPAAGARNRSTNVIDANGTRVFFLGGTKEYCCVLFCLHQPRLRIRPRFRSYSCHDSIQCLAGLHGDNHLVINIKREDPHHVQRLCAPPPYERDQGLFGFIQLKFSD